MHGSGAGLRGFGGCEFGPVVAPVVGPEGSAIDAGGDLNGRTSAGWHPAHTPVGDGLHRLPQLLCKGRDTPGDSDGGVERRFSVHDAILNAPCSFGQRNVLDDSHNLCMESTVYERVAAELERRKAKNTLPNSWASLGRVIETTSQQMHNWSRRDVPASHHLAIANALDWSVEELLGVAPLKHERHETSERGVAQSVSLSNPIVVPILTWGDLMSRELPDVFKVELPDNAMAPKAGRGAMIEFSQGLVPEPGDGVLVRDSSGGVHFREFRPALGGAWTAFARNEAFPSFHSERDGLKLLAVLTSVTNRWSR